MTKFEFYSSDAINIFGVSKLHFAFYDRGPQPTNVKGL